MLAAMTLNDEQLALFASVDPAAVERVRRLAFAIALIRGGIVSREVSRRVAERYQVSRITAWRIASMAQDLAGREQ
jgi:hypothetical protein